MSETAFRLLTEALNLRRNRNLQTPPELAYLLTHSARNSNIHLIETDFNKAIGYIAWISTSKEGLIFAKRYKCLPMKSLEWNDGRLVIIYDAVFLPKWGFHARDLLCRYLSKYHFIALFKRNKIRVLRKPSTLERFCKLSVLGDKR